MRQGVLIYDHDTDRMDIRFDLDDYYGGLHCGTSMEVFVNNKWVPTRIEINDQWYLVGIKTGNLIGLRVRIKYSLGAVSLNKDCPIFISKFKKGERCYEMLVKVPVGKTVSGIFTSGQGANGLLGKAGISCSVSKGTCPLLWIQK